MNDKSYLYIASKHCKMLAFIYFTSQGKLIQLVGARTNHPLCYWSGLPGPSLMQLHVFPYLRAMTDEALYPNLLGLVSASRLKYRERDAMDAVCRTWFTLTAGQYDPSLSWLDRLHLQCIVLATQRLPRK